MLVRGRPEVMQRASTYQPLSRRPIANVLRRTADAAVNVCLRWHVHPDTISYTSMVAAAAAGVCFWQSGSWPVLLFPAGLLLYVRL